MTTIYEASLVGNKLRIKDKPIDKKKAMSRVRRGEDVYTTKSQAHTLSIALNEGGGAWKDGPHVVGGYKHTTMGRISTLGTSSMGSRPGEAWERRHAESMAPLH